MISISLPLGRYISFLEINCILQGTIVTKGALTVGSPDWAACVNYKQVWQVFFYKNFRRVFVKFSD